MSLYFNFKYYTANGKILILLAISESDVLPPAKKPPIPQATNSNLLGHMGVATSWHTWGTPVFVAT